MITVFCFKLSIHYDCKLHFVILYTYPDHVLHGIHIRVPHVDPNGTEREAVLPSGAVNDHRRPKAASAEREVPVGGRVPR